MFLYINTAINGRSEVALVDIKNNNNVIVVDKMSSVAKSDKSIILLDKLFNKNKITPKKLSGVFVVNGPGPFTAIRIAVALANSFSYVLSIPVFGIEFVSGKKTEELIHGVLGNIKKVSKNKIVKPINNL